MKKSDNLPKIMERVVEVEKGRLGRSVFWATLVFLLLSPWILVSYWVVESDIVDLGVMDLVFGEQSWLQIFVNEITLEWMLIGILAFVFLIWGIWWWGKRAVLSKKTLTEYKSKR